MVAPTRTLILDPPIEGFGVRVDFKVHWNGEMLLIVDHFNAPISSVKLYKVGLTGATSFIGESDPLTKDDSGSAGIDERNGDVILAVSEALEGQSGSTSGVRKLYIWSGFFLGRPAISTTDSVARATAGTALLLAQSIRSTLNTLLAALKHVCLIQPVP